MRTEAVNTTENTLNRRNVAEFISRLSREMEDIADALLEKREPANDKPVASVLLRSAWLTTGVFAMTKPWDAASEFDKTNLVLLRSSWLTAGAEPRCN